MNFLKALWAFIEAIFMRPNYDEPVMENTVNKEVDEAVKEVMKSKRQRILEAARTALGTDASPNNKTSRETACAETVSHIIHPITESIPTDVLSTVELTYYLDQSHEYIDTRLPKEGNIIMSHRKGGQLGHTGIFITPDTIASNDSRTGKFEINYNLDEWAAEMRGKRWLNILIFEAV